MAENGVKELKEFFSVEGNPVSTAEMMEFWKSLTEEEKAYFKSAPLS